MLPPQSGDSHEIRGVIALWRAVLVQHIMDAKSRSSKPEADYYRNQALHFLFDDTRNFRMVCELADLNPDKVRQKLHAARERGFIWRAGNQQATKAQEKITTRKQRRAVLVELGLFPKLEKRPAPKKLKPRARGNHIRALRQFSTQMELTF